MSNKFPPSAVALGLTAILLVLTMLIVQYVPSVLFIYKVFSIWMFWYLFRCWVETKRDRSSETKKEKLRNHRFGPGVVAIGWLLLVIVFDAIVRVLNYYVPFTWFITTPIYLGIVWYLIRNWVIFSRAKNGNENIN